MDIPFRLQRADERLSRRNRMKRMEHEDVMELAVQLTCSYLGTSHSGSTNAEDLMLTYYQQIRNVEARLDRELVAARAMGGGDDDEDEHED
jgi:hypothetical protein